LSFLTKDVLFDADHILGVKKPSFFNAARGLGHQDCGTTFFNAARGLGHQDCGTTVCRNPAELVGIGMYMVIDTYMWIFVKPRTLAGPLMIFLPPARGKAPIPGATAGYWA
jgi:hypothetical protein